MELADRTVMLLGGSGLVGHAVARRVLAATPPPRRLVLVALFEDEVRAAARALEPYRGSVTIDVEWGNVFMPAPVARLDIATIMGNGEHRALVLGDLLGDLSDGVLERNLLFRLLVRYKPDAVVDSINTATAFAYQDIFQSARTLLARAQDGGVDRAAVEQHLLRLPLPQLIRHAQIITEALRRAGTQAYVKIGTSGTGGMGFNIPYTHSEERPSAPLLTKSAIAGAHSMLLFLLGRTPDAPVTVEIKPTATIAWREVAHVPVRRNGKRSRSWIAKRRSRCMRRLRPGRNRGATSAGHSTACTSTSAKMDCSPATSSKPSRRWDRWNSSRRRKSRTT